LGQFQLDAGALAWLELILMERFGVEFILSRESNLVVNLKVLGSSSVVNIISRVDGAAQILDGRETYWWDAVSAGWVSVVGGCIPAPGLEDLQGELIQPTEKGYVIQYDFLNLMFVMLCRLEEYSSNDLDSHGRFKSANSISVRGNYIDRPIIDEWLEILRQIIVKTWPDLSVKQDVYSMCLSHDVDRPSRYSFSNFRSFGRAVAADLILNRSLYALLAPIIRVMSGTRLHPLDPYNTFDWLMTVSEQAGLKSTFFFMAGITAPTFDAGYQLAHPAIKNLCSGISARGHEVGLHPSYGTYRQASIIQKEFNCLKENVLADGEHQDRWGVRMHYLRYSMPDTLMALNEANFTYDTSLGYPDRPGFRCGTCIEYPAYDPIADRILEIRILPLIAMDTSLFSSNYMGFEYGDDAMNFLVDLIRKCRIVGGQFTLLWHNSNLENDIKKSFYRSIVDFGCR
jgi:hypothetical protein